MKANLPLLAFAIPAALTPHIARSDCSGLVAYFGTARIQIMSAEPAPNSEEHLRVRISVTSSVDAFLGTTEFGPGPISVELLDTSFFAGEHISALRCEHAVCSQLLAVNFEQQAVDAHAQLFIDCPDTGVAVNEVRLQFAEIDILGNITYVPIMEISGK